MRVHPRTIKSTKQVSFWLGKLNFWTNIVANPKTKCLSAILGHAESANYSIIRSRLSLLRHIKPYFNFDSSLHFYNSCVNNYVIYFTYCSAAWGNCSTIFCYVPVCVLLQPDFSQACEKIIASLWRENWSSENWILHKSRGGEWYLEKRGSRKILAGFRNLGSVFDKSRSLVFAWFVFTFFESRNFLPKSLGLGFLTRISASRRVSDFTIRHP